MSANALAPQNLAFTSPSSSFFRDNTDFKRAIQAGAWSTARLFDKAPSDDAPGTCSSLSDGVASARAGLTPPRLTIVTLQLLSTVMDGSEGTIWDGQTAG